MGIELPPVPPGHDGYYVAFCPEHGLHGERDCCFTCGEPALQVPMLPSGPVQPRDPMARPGPKPWRCRLGMHTSERSQGRVGYCLREGCGHLKHVDNLGQGAKVRYRPQGAHVPPPAPPVPLRPSPMLGERGLRVVPTDVGPPPADMTPGGLPMPAQVNRVDHHYYYSAHAPNRGSEVEAWLRRMRDGFAEYGPAWGAVDLLLDRYRECSDLGLTLKPEDDERGDP